MVTVKPGYQPQASDTSLETDVYEFALLRQKSNSDRWNMAAQLIQWTKKLSLQGIQKARPVETNRYFAQAVLGDKWAPALTPTNGDTTMWVQDPGAIAQLLHPIFEQFNIPYYITGGVAAILYGEPRTTRDLDVVINLQREQLPLLVTALETSGFYCPPGAIEELQTGQGQTFSVTHMTMVLNADLVLNSDTPFDRSKMERRRLESFGETDKQQFWVASPEDLVLAKLLWRQRSQSEKQWRDVLGVLKVQGETLDFDYLFQWADALLLTEALSQAIVAAGLTTEP